MSTSQSQWGYENSNPGGDTTVQRGVTGSSEPPTTEREEFGKMRFGACFFGWLTASGVLVLLTAVASGVGLVWGQSLGYSPTSLPTAEALQSASLLGGIVLLVMILVAYFAGGYVAGRMARFSGLKQGLGVWLWAVILVVVTAVAGWVGASQLGGTGLPQNPLELTGTGIGPAAAGVGIIAAVSLVGALLGGLAGMPFHRRIDRADLVRG